MMNQHVNMGRVLTISNVALLGVVVDGPHEPVSYFALYIKEAE